MLRTVSILALLSLVTPPAFARQNTDEAERSGDNVWVYAFIEGTRTGLMDQRGRVLIEPRFDGAGQASGFLIPVRVGASWGLWSAAKHDFVLEPEYENVETPGESFVRVQTQSGWSFVPVQTNGERLPAQTEYYRLREPESSVASFAVRQDRGPVDERTRWGVITVQGDTLVAPTFENILAFNEGLAAARISRKFLFIRRSPAWGFINTEGTWIIEPKFDSARGFSDGLALVSESGALSYIDSSGEVAFDAPFDLAFSFSEGRARVVDGTRWGFLGPEGDVVIAPDWEGALDFSSGRAAVLRGDSWGYIDRQGAILIPLVYDAARPFNGPLALVRRAGRTFYIDASGDEVSPTRRP